MNYTDNTEILNSLKIAKQKVGVQKNIGIIVNKNNKKSYYSGIF